MKMFVFLLLIITTIYCSYDSCENEYNYTNCLNHTIDELTGFSCRFFLDDSNDVDVKGDLYSESYCHIFPDAAKNQKIEWKIEQGFTLETMSSDPESVNESHYVVEPQKEFYDKNETILIKKKLISNEDLTIIKSKNTCAYQAMINYNLTNKNICFNTNRFPELKDLVNCGYTNITINKTGKIFTRKTCFYIPDNHLPDEFQNLFSKMFVRNGIWAVAKDMDKLEEFPGGSKLAKRKKEKRRNLEDDEIKFEMTVEDKYGKIYKYTDKKLEPEIIEEGSQGDKIYDDENTNNKTKSYNCSGNDFFIGKCIPNNITNSSDRIASDYIYEILEDIKNGKFNDIFENVIAENKTYDATESNITYIISTVSSQYSTNYSTVDLKKCEALLKEKFLLDKNETLILLKLEYNIEKLKIPIIEYQFFIKNGTRINLSYCLNITELVSIPVNISEEEEFIHNPNSYYYNDKCSIYTSEYGTDLSMYDRKNNYNKKYLALCEKNCKYKRYNKRNQRVECKCKTKTKFPELVEKAIKELSLKELLHQFTDVIKHWNLFLFKCYKVVFSSEGLKKNSGSYINIIIISGIIFCTIFFGVKGYTLYKNRIIDIVNKELDDSKQNQTLEIFNNKIIFNRNDLNNLEKPNNMSTNDDINNSNYIPSEINLNTKLTKSYNDFEMNNLEYNNALIQDNRSFCQMYVSFIKTKHPIYFTFLLENDYNSRIIKICLFIFSFSLEYSINALFFNDSTMHKIYEDRGDYNFIYQLPQIIYSFLISLVITKLLSHFILSEEKVAEIVKIKNLETENKINVLFRKSIYKLIIFFVLILLIQLLFLYYLSSFCGVYKNTQGALITDTIISFVISLFIYSYIFCLIPCTMRYYSLKGKNKDRKCLYNASNIISDIIL